MRIGIPDPAMRRSLTEKRSPSDSPTCERSMTWKRDRKPRSGATRTLRNSSRSNFRGFVISGWKFAPYSDPNKPMER